MATTVGTIDTAVLLKVGDSTPIEVATITPTIRATCTGATVHVNTPKWRRTLALTFLRLAWHLFTSRR
ncbi:hypothetical protein EV140_1934 [Microcella alkaliphila]|uniref:Uncharacterized protein n=1 Tax=Microcella alkaliphila TaxID=279828 RepID=A0A4V2FMX8_9MICO|nr:hypothetical protein [Microcella alkaliphila]RZT59329.1 hypothetical protein EV140_1934 [Microcella alkaliphila]